METIEYEEETEEYAPDYDEIGKDIRMGIYEYELGGMKK